MSTPIVILDTNFLLDRPLFRQEAWQLRPLEVWITEGVEGEVHGLRNSNYSEVAAKAKRAWDEVVLLRRSPNCTEEKVGVTFRIVPDDIVLKPPLEPGVVDHLLIGMAHHELHRNPPRFCAILTNDKELDDRAEALSVPALPVDKGGFFHTRLDRMFGHWLVGQANNQAQKSPRRPKSKTLATRLDGAKQLRRSAAKWYRRWKVAGGRGIFNLSPRQARLELAAQIIERVANPDKRVVIVVVESHQAAEEWAADLRQRLGALPADIQIFGQNLRDRPERARAVIYRHDQVVRRLPTYIDEWNRMGRRRAAVVDGCDLLDPVDLALLLFDCDQFAGIVHYPLDYGRTPGNRMLHTFLRNHFLQTCSFTDAQRGGWGHAGHLFLQAVPFIEDEQTEWDKDNKAYLERRERAARKHPELRIDTDGDFWEVLTNFLRRGAHPDEAEILLLWEKREHWMLTANHKAAVVADLVREVGSISSSRPRQLILDYEGIWTPVLLKQLNQAAKLPESGPEQLPIWNAFAGNQYSTLLLSKSPGVRLPKTYIQRLIILTPLQPLAEINAVIDWALNQTEEPLRIDLLFVDDTPEEIAALKLAAASFDLRY